MLAGLNCTLDEWLCDSFVELIEDVELWKWDGMIIDENVKKLQRRDTTLCYTCIEGDCRIFLIVWGQPNRGAFMYLL